MTISKRKTILQSFMDEIWNAGDFSNLDNFISNAYTIQHDPGDAWDGQTLDKATFIERVMYSCNAFPNLNFDIQQMIEEDNQIVAFWIMSGTHQGDLPNLPATGRPFSISGMTIYEFDNDDKLIGHTQAYDRLGFFMQMGGLG